MSSAYRLLIYFPFNITSLPDSSSNIDLFRLMIPIIVNYSILVPIWNIYLSCFLFQDPEELVVTHLVKRLLVVNQAQVYTATFISRYHPVKTLIQKKTSILLRLLRKPNWVLLISARSFLYMGLWMMLSRIFRVWLIKLFVLKSEHSFFGTGMKTDFNHSFDI